MGMDNPWRPFSRRELLKRVGGAGAAAALPTERLLPVIEPSESAAATLQDARPENGPAVETLSTMEAEILEAITARLIPSDESGPGAAEARAARYIDRALGGALAPFREAYRLGLVAADSYARASRSASFIELSTTDQDAVLGDMERNVATGFMPDASTFFALVLSHTIQGTFCDPYYGGNANFVGWDLLGYPGVRLTVSAGQQRLDRRPAPSRMSAYDYPMFGRRPPAQASHGEKRGAHGD